ncbi:MAG: HNH endonuclease, partial [Sporichthyaceae bacterium]|nr:HNH endonuclease [Sporichthyaceae bacterium]
MSENPARQAAVYVPLPEGLEDLPPGPELGALLASVDRSTCNGYQLVGLITAGYRQIAWQQAQLLADVGELMLTRPGEPEAAPARQEPVNTQVYREVGFALRLAPGTGEELAKLAVKLRDELPVVGQALAAGRIDLPKARLMVRELAGLDDPDLANMVASRVLGQAEAASLGLLRERLRGLILAVDPDAARTRHSEAVARRRVRRTPHPEDTTSLNAIHLPADKAAAGWDYLTRLATAAKKAGGETRSMDQLRADLLADLLAGVDPTQAGSPIPAPRKGTLTLTVELTTLMNLLDHPGELGGYGPVLADMARQLAEAERDRLVWRFATIHGGRVIYEGRLRYKPTAAQMAYVRARDRHCVAPGCPRPASDCEIDHIIDFHTHGPTMEDNLCPLCKRDHLTKTSEGYQLYRTDEGYVWVTPMGRVYPVSYGRELTQPQRQLLHQLIRRSETTHPMRQ